MRKLSPLVLATIAGFLGGMVGSAGPSWATRNSSGTYSLPYANVTSGTTITSTWANGTLSDISTEITNSLDRGGRGAMTAGLPLYAGTSGAPGLTFSGDLDTGIYRAGSADIEFQVDATTTQKWLSTGATFPRSIVVTTAFTNDAGIIATGNGTAGGVWGNGGTSNGAGIVGTGGTTNGVGGSFLGAGTGAGLVATSGTGAGAPGATFTANGSGFSHGISATGTAQGYGGVFTGGATAGNGIQATAGGNGVGVSAITPSSGTGAALSADASAGTGYGASIKADTTSAAHAALHLEPQDAQPTGANAIGDMYVTTAGVLKICTAAGSPGTWASVGAQ